jgi:SAM-dependent methyltransferase
VLVDVLADLGIEGPVLDYGCGQGVFLTVLLEGGIDVFGCDPDPEIPNSEVPKDRLLPQDAPWNVPPGSWGAVVFLDVLEHSDQPVEVLKNLDTRHVILKVPNARGPAALMARVLNRLGQPGLLDRLFLVGENFPHIWIATDRGLSTIAKRAGWSISQRIGFAEVGKELPDRMRSGVEVRGVRRFFISVVGLFLALVGPVWSDTKVVVLSRNGSN